MIRRGALGAAALALLVTAQAWAQGGPPLVTDDPGTVPLRHWEINIAALLSSAAGQNVFQAPYFDINYGATDRLQLKLETGWVLSLSTGVPAQSSWDIVLVGAKFRFLDQDRVGVDVATYPQFQFHVVSSGGGELTAPGNYFFLPVELSRSVGDWGFNPELGYLYSTETSDSFEAGLVVAYEALKPWEPLAEIHATTHLDGGGSETLLNLGFRYTASSWLNLLGALGHTVTHFEGSTTEADAYFGFQLEL